MKKVVLLVLLMGLLATAIRAENQSIYFYNEIVLKSSSDWLYWGAVYGDNRNNERYLSLRLFPQKPLDIPWSHTLEFGLNIRDYKYEEWSEAKRISEPREKQFIEFFLGPETDLNWGWFNIKLRDELKINYNGKFNDNLFLAQVRGYPYRYLQMEASYSIFYNSEMEKSRLAGTSSELRMRIGTALGGIFEPGVQLTAAHYRSKEDIWESQYRPKIGFYCRLIHLPFGLWGEVSWEKLQVREEDLRSKEIFPDFEQERILIAFGLSQDEKKVR